MQYKDYKDVFVDYIYLCLVIESVAKWSANSSHKVNMEQVDVPKVHAFLNIY